MKKLIFIFSFLFISLLAFAESVHPTFGVKIERPVSIAIIDGKYYYNVSVELDAGEENSFWTPGVKITVKDAENPKKKIYKKRFSDSYLYGMSDGSIVVGKTNVLIQVLLIKSKTDDSWGVSIREKGLY